jgi:hypothetical protein
MGMGQYLGDVEALVLAGVMRTLADFREGWARACSGLARPALESM